MEKIKFQIEINRVLDVLSKEIYDTPYALLRENIQNAYDAILMREQYSEGTWSSQKNGKICVQIDNEKIIISDNGIGMYESILKNNYWKAGSSGKQTNLAKKAGVVGIFGIGAMANFGICTKLKVETESIETKEKIISEVERDNLSLTEECIRIQKIPSIEEYGTTITTILEEHVEITSEQAINYLRPYTQYLPVCIEVNGNKISQKSIEKQFQDNSAKLQKNWNGFEHGGIKADVLIQCNDLARISATVKNIFISNEAIKATVCLRQDSGHLWGLRSSFGLAPVPFRSFYSFGGIVDLSILSPTAGRDALNRESIEIIKKIISLVDTCATNTLAESELCNKSTAFISSILSIGKIELGKNLKIKIAPDEEITLGELKKVSKIRKYSYYEGNDKSIIKECGTPDTPLVVLSRTNPRRKLEARFINELCNLEKITDSPRVLDVFSENDYKIDEVSFVIRAKHILEEDYALQNVEIKFAKLSHNLPYFIEYSNKSYIQIYLQREHSTTKTVLKCYDDAYDIFTGFIKDYIRVHIYPRIKDWVPSSTREGAEALQKILRSKKELYEIKTEDVERGDLLSLFSDIKAGKLNLKDVFINVQRTKRTQTQEITERNVGNLESEIPDLSQSPVQLSIVEEKDSILSPMPAILRTEVDTKKKLLLVNKITPSLNNFQMFLAIYNRAFREEYDFFITPHITRIIWGGHRIIYIFTHASGRFSLYYDIEMFKDTRELAGSEILPTTTIVTKNRIFIPVPNSLKRFFEFVGEKMRFYVKFDTLSSN